MHFQPRRTPSRAALFVLRRMAPTATTSISPPTKIAIHHQSGMHRRLPVQGALTNTRTAEITDAGDPCAVAASVLAPRLRSTQRRVEPVRRAPPTRNEESRSLSKRRRRGRCQRGHTALHCVPSDEVHADCGHRIQHLSISTPQKTRTRSGVIRERWPTGARLRQ